MVHPCALERCWIDRRALLLLVPLPSAWLEGIVSVAAATESGTPRLFLSSSQDTPASDRPSTPASTSALNALNPRSGMAGKGALRRSICRVGPLTAICTVLPLPLLLPLARPLLSATVITGRAPLWLRSNQDPRFRYIGSAAH